MDTKHLQKYSVQQLEIKSFNTFPVKYTKKGVTFMLNCVYQLQCCVLCSFNRHLWFCLKRMKLILSNVECRSIFVYCNLYPLYITFLYPACSRHVRVQISRPFHCVLLTVSFFLIRSEWETLLREVRHCVCMSLCMCVFVHFCNILCYNFPSFSPFVLTHFLFSVCLSVNISFALSSSQAGTLTSGASRAHCLWLAV